MKVSIYHESCALHYHVFLLIIYKLFVGPHLYYGDTVNNQQNNSTLSDKTESLQYNVTLPITELLEVHQKKNCIKY